MELKEYIFIGKSKDLAKDVLLLIKATRLVEALRIFSERMKNEDDIDLMKIFEVEYDTGNVAYLEYTEEVSESRQST